MNETKFYFVTILFVLNRLWPVCMIPIITIVAFPFVLSMALWMLGCCTNYSFWTLLITCMLTLWGRAQILRLSETPVQARAALEKNRVILPVRIFVLTCLVLWQIGPMLDRILSLFWLGGLLTMNLSSSFHVVSWIGPIVHVAFAMLVMGMLVAARYIGRASILRCSAFPVVDTFQSTMQYYWYRPWNILQSGESGDLRFSSFFESTMGRRLRRPTATSYFQHVCLSILAGYLVSWTFASAIVSPYATMEGCLVITMTTIFTITGGDKHELDPALYNGSGWMQWRSLDSIPWISINGTVLARQAVIVSFVSLLCGFLYGLPVTGLLWRLLASGGSTLYLYALDQTMRMELFKQNLDLIREIHNQDGDDEYGVSLVQVILRSLLNDRSLVDQIWNPRGLEMKLFDEFSDRVATMMQTRIDRHKEQAMEEDVLRVTILQSLGSDKVRSFDNRPRLTSAGRNKGTLLDYIRPESQFSSLEPLYYPLLRGLSVYISGFGKTLSVLATGETSQKIKKPSSSFWSLPPAALYCAENAVMAIFQCVTVKLFPGTHNEIGCNIPLFLDHAKIVMQSIYQLRSGTEFYLEAHKNGSGEGKVAKRYLNLTATCDKVAESILMTIKDINSIHTLDRALKQDCIKWKQELLSKPSMQSRLIGYRSVQ